MSSVGYLANFQDYAIKRVPRNHDDLLPDSDRKDNLRRRLGNSTFLEIGSKYQISRPLTFGVYYDILYKDPDWYDGDKGWNYAGLSVDTGSQTHQVKLFVEFSTLSWYATKLFSVPFMLGYIYGNTVFAVNAPQIISNQLNLRMFF